MKKISNEEYLEAYNNDNYKNIMAKAMSRFKIDRFEAVRIKDDALWMAMQTHDPLKSKFETYLFNKVRWMCRRQVWSRSPKNKTFHNKMEIYKEMDLKILKEGYDPEKGYINKIMCDEILSILSEEDRQIITEKYLLSKTLKEIASTRGVSLQRIEQKINKIIEKIKLKFVRENENSVYK